MCSRFKIFGYLKIRNAEERGKNNDFVTYILSSNFRNGSLKKIRYGFQNTKGIFWKFEGLIKGLGE